MANIFGKTPKTTGAGFSVDRATFSFSGLTTATGPSGTQPLASGGVGLLIQNVQLQYQQQLNFIYDLSNPEAVYYVAGRAEGTLQIGKVVGDQSGMARFFETFGNVCQARLSATINGLTGCNSVTTGPTINAQQGFTIADPIIASYGLSMTVNEGIVSEQVQMRFTDMSLGADTPTATGT